MSLITWTIQKGNSDVTVHLDGTVNEEFAYKELVADLKDFQSFSLRLHLKQLRRINSMGIREWFNFLRDLAWPHPIILCECSLIFTEVLSQIEELGHGCLIESCYLPVWCDSCEEEFELRLDLNVPLAEQPQEMNCPTCSSQCVVETWSIEDILEKQMS